jgi:hypothetical protein
MYVNRVAGNDDLPRRGMRKSAASRMGSVEDECLVYRLAVNVDVDVLVRVVDAGLCQ